MALLVGTALAIGALALVLYPLFVEPSPARRVRRTAAAPSETEGAVAALREIEFDRETGKLSDADYAALKAEYTRDALAAMRAEESAAAEAEDPAEAAVLRYRLRAPVCAQCGPRPEPDAAYCSGCGHYLAGRCGDCGAPVIESGAAYCAACGHALAA